MNNSPQPDDLPTLVTALIQRKLDSEHLSVAAFARRCGLAPTTIHSILDHPTRRAQLDTLAKLAIGLETSVTVLVHAQRTNETDDGLTTLLDIWAVLPLPARQELVSHALTLERARAGVPAGV